jgi:hypothetical protein
MADDMIISDGTNYIAKAKKDLSLFFGYFIEIPDFQAGTGQIKGLQEFKLSKPLCFPDKLFMLFELLSGYYQF